MRLAPARNVLCPTLRLSVRGQLVVNEDKMTYRLHSAVSKKKKLELERDANIATAKRTHLHALVDLSLLSFRLLLFYFTITLHTKCRRKCINNASKN